MSAFEPKAPVEDDRLIGMRVRTCRIMARMSQEELAEAIGLTFQQVQKYEKGINRISASRLQQIATALRVSVADLFGQDNNPISGTGTHPERLAALLADGGLALLEAFYEVRDLKARQAVLEVVRSMSRPNCGR